MDEKQLFQSDYMNDCTFKNEYLNRIIYSMKKDQFVHNFILEKYFYKNNKILLVELSNRSFTMYFPDNPYIDDVVTEDFSGSSNPLVLVGMLISEHMKFYIKMHDNYYKFLEVFFVNFKEIMHWVKKYHIKEVLDFIEEIFTIRTPLKDKLPTQTEAIIDLFGGMEYAKKVIDSEIKRYYSNRLQLIDTESKKIYDGLSLGGKTDEYTQISSLINGKCAARSILSKAGKVLKRTANIILFKITSVLPAKELSFIVHNLEKENIQQTMVFSQFLYYQFGLLRYPFNLLPEKINETPLNDKLLEWCAVLPDYLSDMVKVNLLIMNKL